MKTGGGVFILSRPSKIRILGVRPINIRLTKQTQEQINFVLQFWTIVVLCIIAKQWIIKKNWNCNLLLRIVCVRIRPINLIWSFLWEWRFTKQSVFVGCVWPQYGLTSVGSSLHVIILGEGCVSAALGAGSHSHPNARSSDW